VVHRVTGTVTAVIDPDEYRDRRGRSGPLRSGVSLATESGEDLISVSSSRSGDIVYLALRGELDTANIDEVRGIAQHAVDAAGV
jgi:hypothetical protein